MAALDTLNIPEAPVSEGAIQTTAPKSTGITGKIALDPTQTESILANMQKYIDEREGFMPSLAAGINKARAGLAGPSALTAYQQQENLQDKQMMDYRTQMAAYRAAQAQAANEAARYQSMTPGATPAAGGAVPQATAGAAPQATAGGVPISAEQLAIENSLGTAAEKLESRRKYLGTRSTENIKLENAPGMRDVVEIYVPGEGNVQMTKAQAEKLLTANPKLQAIVGGSKVPAAQAIAATPGGTNLGNMRPPGKSTGFQEPTTPDKDIARIDANLKSYGDKGINTLSGVISKWSPPNENDTPALIKNAAKFLGIDPNQPIDLQNPAVRQAISTAIIKQEGNLPKVFATAAAPSLAAQPAKPDETRAQYERRLKEEAEIGSSRIKAGEIKREEIINAQEGSVDIGNSINRIESIMNTPAGNRAVGMFDRPGVVAAFGKILSEGISAGNYGQVSFKGLGDAVRVAGGDQATIDAAQKLGRDFAEMQLIASRRFLKGQGAVSDNERNIIERVTGSVANSPEVIKDFTRWNRVRNEYDRDVGDALQKWETSNPNKSIDLFKNSDEFKTIKANYIAKTDAMANKMGITGQKTAPSGSGVNINELLKQYTPKKAS